MARADAPFVFRDDDGQRYLSYGGWKRCNIARLKPDLLGLAPFSDAWCSRTSTPRNTSRGHLCSLGRASTTGCVARPDGRTALQRGLRHRRLACRPLLARRQSAPAGSWRRHGAVHHSLSRSQARIRGTSFTIGARSARRTQPPGSVHRRDALQRGRHHPPDGPDRVSTGKRRRLSAVGPESRHTCGCGPFTAAQKRYPKPAPSVSGCIESRATVLTSSRDRSPVDSISDRD